MRKVKTNLFTVAVYSPKGKLERYRSMRLIAGNLFEYGSVVTMTPDNLPFKNRQYTVIGREPEGTPKVQVR